MSADHPTSFSTCRCFSSTHLSVVFLLITITVTTTAAAAAAVTEDFTRSTISGTTVTVAGDNNAPAPRAVFAREHVAGPYTTIEIVELNGFTDNSDNAAEQKSSLPFGRMTCKPDSHMLTPVLVNPATVASATTNTTTSTATSFSSLIRLYFICAKHKDNQDKKNLKGGSLFMATSKDGSNSWGPPVELPILSTEGVAVEDLLLIGAGPVPNPQDPTLWLLPAFNSLSHCLTFIALTDEGAKVHNSNSLKFCLTYVRSASVFPDVVISDSSGSKKRPPLIMILQTSAVGKTLQSMRCTGDCAKSSDWELNFISSEQMKVTTVSPSLMAVINSAQFLPPETPNNNNNNNNGGNDANHHDDAECPLLVMGAQKDDDSGLAFYVASNATSLITGDHNRLSPLQFDGNTAAALRGIAVTALRLPPSGGATDRNKKANCKIRWVFATVNEAYSVQLSSGVFSNVPTSKRVSDPSKGKPAAAAALTFIIILTVSIILGAIFVCGYIKARKNKDTKKQDEDDRHEEFPFSSAAGPNPSAGAAASSGAAAAAALSTAAPLTGLPAPVITNHTFSNASIISASAAQQIIAASSGSAASDPSAGGTVVRTSTPPPISADVRRRQV